MPLARKAGSGYSRRTERIPNRRAARRPAVPATRIKPAYRTPWGRAYHADALDVLRQPARRIRRARLHVAAVRPAPAEGLRQRRRRRVHRLVLAVRRADPPRPAARRQLRHGAGRRLEPRQRHALAVPLRAAPAPRQDLPPGAGLLLVQPVAAADAGRVGDDSPHARQGSGQHALVAVEDDGAAGRQSPRAAAVQQVDEAAAARTATSRRCGRRSTRSARTSSATTAARSRRTS